MQILLQSLYVMLPAYIANMAPVIFRGIAWGETPLDLGHMWHGKRILGDHKTFRGLFLGIITAIVTIYLQRVAMRHTFFSSISLINYAEPALSQLILIGFLFGFGALAGDSIKSFFKRRANIKEGASWMPFDQLDFVVGALLCAGWFFPLGVAHILLILFVSPILHVLSNVWGYYVGINSKPL